MDENQNQDKEKAKKEMPPRSIEIEVNVVKFKNKYEIKYPITGQQIDIEVMKSRLSAGQFSNLLSSAANAATLAAFNIEMIATFNVLCPKLKDDLKVDSLLELDMVDSKILLDIYVKKVLPWLNQWRDFLDTPIEESVS